jgi:hypothetical protein
VFAQSEIAKSLNPNALPHSSFVAILHERRLARKSGRFLPRPLACQGFRRLACLGGPR